MIVTIPIAVISQEPLSPVLGKYFKCSFWLLSLPFITIDFFESVVLGSVVLGSVVLGSVVLGSVVLGIVLYSHTSLQPAIHIYEKFNFKEVPVTNTEYARCNYQAELLL